MYTKHLLKRAFDTWQNDGVEFLFEKSVRYLTKRKVSCPENKKLFVLKMLGCADSLRQKEIDDFSLKLPLDFEVPQHDLRLAALIHIFYVDLADEIIKHLNNVPNKIDLYISTADEKKQFFLQQKFASFAKGQVTIEVFPNRGRDIAPSFVGFADVFDKYDAIVHLHSKKTAYAKNKLFGWRNYLYDNILGSRETVSSILHILAATDVGAIFPQYYSPLRDNIRWGENYPLTCKLLNECGITITDRHLLEFPAGFMFWFKPQALRSLSRRSLSFADFPAEAGEIDGTLAHAVERAVLYMVEAEGYRWTKICTQPAKAGDAPILCAKSEEELTAALNKIWQPVKTEYAR